MQGMACFESSEFLHRLKAEDSESTGIHFTATIKVPVIPDEMEWRGGMQERDNEVGSKRWILPPLSF